MAEPAVPRSAADGEASVGDLVSLAVRDVTRLVRCELELARLELRADGRRLFMSVALTGVAGFAGILVMFMLSYALAFGLITAGIWNWAAFLIVAGAYVVLGALAMLVVYIALRRITGLRKTRDTVQEDLAVLRGARKRPSRRQSRPGDPMAGNGGSPIYVDGPWSHRPVTANGTRFHIAEAGEGPLVLLLHGFPQFWWTWRAQLTSLPAAGYRAVAADLRGYGGSDKPPRGYDLITAASDAAGMVRALGEANAVVVGHDWGGLVAWTMATYFPKVVRRLAVVSVAHPLRMRATLLTDAVHQAGSGQTFGFQLPVLPERRLVRHDARWVGRMLHDWSGPGWPDPEVERRYRAAMCIPSVAHSALEYHRWFVRSRLRSDGMRYAHRMRAPVQAPTLQLHGALDSCVPAGHRAWQRPLR